MNAPVSGIEWVFSVELMSSRQARHGQDVRNSGHYKTINRWKEPNYSDNK